MRSARNWRDFAHARAAQARHIRRPGSAGAGHQSQSPARRTFRSALRSRFAVAQPAQMPPFVAGSRRQE